MASTSKYPLLITVWFSPLTRDCCLSRVAAGHAGARPVAGHRGDRPRLVLGRNSLEEFGGTSGTSLQLPLNSNAASFDSIEARLQPVAYRTTVVTSRLTGIFPGSPIDLRFFFRLE